jgi:hypothetical protein
VYPPAVRIDELPLCRVRDQLLDQRTALGLRHAEDAARVRGEVERLAAGLRDRADEDLRHRRHVLPLVVAEIGEAEAGARVEDRVLGDEPVEAALDRVGQRVVGGALVGEFRVSADRRDRARVEQQRGAAPAA